MRIFGTEIQISPYAFVYLALAVLLIPLRWLGAMLLAGAVHEMGHLLALHLLGIRVEAVTLGISGARIRVGALSPGRELLCAAAGPGAGALLILGARLYPELAICAFVQTLFNLLPLLPYDGGRVLRCLLLWLLPPYRVCGIMAAVEWIFLAGILGSLALLFWKGLGALLGFGVLLGATALVKRKIACKAGWLAVQ